MWSTGLERNGMEMNKKKLKKQKQMDVGCITDNLNINVGDQQLKTRKKF